MGVSQNDGSMEGWLYTIRQNRLGLQFSRKRYFVLRDNNLKIYKSIPSADNEEPDRRASLDCCIRVTDNGRESFHRKILFIFTLYNTSNHSDQLKLGASSPEDAAKWIRSLQDASLKGSPFPDCDFVSHSERGLVRLDVSKRSRRKNSVDWTNYSSVNVAYSSMNSEITAPDVIAPSPWKIFGCQNGLRLFKEAKDWDSRGRHWEDHPAIMAVGVIDGSSEEIFNTLMSLGPLRSEWDFCFYRGSVVEHLDGHTDIIYQQLYSDWLPWGMKRRDLLLRRYWRREEDGTYVILCHSVYHKKCPPRKGYVRACVKSGGYVVTPMKKGKQSLVKHMIAIDWRFWNLYMRPSSARSITIRMVERVAALREMFQAKQGQLMSNFSSGELMTTKLSSKNKTRVVSFECKEPQEVSKSDVSLMVGEESEKLSFSRSSLMDLNDASDEFFDVPEPVEPSEFDCFVRDTSSQGPQLKLPSAAGLVKKLQDLAVQKKGYVDLQEVATEDKATYFYGATLQKDTSLSLPCSWATADPSTFLIRGSNYLKDHQKEKAKGTLMQMMGADWISSDKREDDLAGRPGGIVQEYAQEGRPEFFFVVNIQVPGSAMYTLALYYMLQTPLEENPLLHNFVNGDDAYRNSRIKLIPHISKGSWIVKQSVGKKACLLGQALETHYVRGKNYLELDIDVGSSTVARGVTNLVLGYLNNLVIEMAFLIQANTEEELPEVLLGTCRLNYLDVSKSVREK